MIYILMIIIIILYSIKVKDRPIIENIKITRRFKFIAIIFSFAHVTLYDVPFYQELFLVKMDKLIIAFALFFMIIDNISDYFQIEALKKENS